MYKNILKKVKKTKNARNLSNNDCNDELRVYFLVL